MYTLNNKQLENFELHFLFHSHLFQKFCYKKKAQAFLKIVLRKRDLISANKTDFIIIICVQIRRYMKWIFEFFANKNLSNFPTLNICSLSWNSKVSNILNLIFKSADSMPALQDTIDSCLIVYILYYWFFVIVELLTQIINEIFTWPRNKIKWGTHGRMANKRGNWFSI